MGGKRTDDLVPEKVLPRGDAARDRERDLALVRDELVDGPRPGGRVQAVFVDLEPLQAGHIALGCIGYFRAIWE